jgi:hypothetical protein
MSLTAIFLMNSKKFEVEKDEIKPGFSHIKAEINAEHIKKVDVDASKKAATKREKKLALKNILSAVTLPPSAAAIGYGIGYGGRIGAFLGPYGIMIGCVAGATLGTICAIKIKYDNDQTYSEEL